MSNFDKVASLTSDTPLSGASPIVVNKVLKNTYILLSFCLGFSALMAYVGMAMGVGQTPAMVVSVVSILLAMFVLPSFANSVGGLPILFVITGGLGLGLAPLLGAYFGAGAGDIVMTAFTGTAGIFLGLSFYALTSKKDFSFLATFVLAGMIGVLVLAIINIFAGIPLLSLALSFAVVLLMTASILMQTSDITKGYQTNYILATMGMFISIFNLFTSLLHILGAMSGDD